MVAAQKQKIADFLDITTDFLGSGYKSEKTNYQFEDDPVPPSQGGADSLEQIAREIRVCRNCSLCEKRLNAAPGEGAAQPLVMVIGEGPGEDEDKQGRPFVGKAGQLLDKMLDAIGLSRSTNCYIANVVKCRPPGNRDPFPEETSACAGFLSRQITLVKPKFILIVGRIAAQAVLQTSESTGKLRAKFLELENNGIKIPVVVTYHPAAVLRNDEYRRPVWEDLKLLKSGIDK
ncbi:MAG: uracil-DNA glycosylase [Treponema sp.]|nr:uracil-DNA glycosylase [Treponema sp.]